MDWFFWVYQFLVFSKRTSSVFTQWVQGTLKEPTKGMPGRHGRFAGGRGLMPTLQNMVATLCIEARKKNIGRGLVRVGRKGESEDGRNPAPYSPDAIEGMFRVACSAIWKGNKRGCHMLTPPAGISVAGSETIPQRYSVLILGTWKCKFTRKQSLELWFIGRTLWWADYPRLGGETLNAVTGNPLRGMSSELSRRHQKVRWWCRPTLEGCGHRARNASRRRIRKRQGMDLPDKPPAGGRPCPPFNGT